MWTPFEGNEVRTVNREGNPWWALTDVCKALEIANSRNITARLDDDEKNTISIADGNRGNPNTTIVNESGLYSLILTSRKPCAKRFKKWVTSEVLPAIRKTGGYMVSYFPVERPQDPQSYKETGEEVDSTLRASMRL